jgi:hypothetical protein
MKHKYLIIALLIIILIMSVFTIVSNAQTDSTNTTKVSEEKSNFDKKLEEYKEKYADYGNDTYATVACILDMIRIYSIPLCFLGIAISAIHQSIIGIRKLDTQEKGLSLMVTFVTIFVICQVLPIAFAIVVRFMRG